MKLDGQVVWGPQTLEAELPCEELKKLVATSMKVRWRAVKLAWGATALDGESLAKKGLLDGKHQIQVVVQDKSHEIRKIQEAIVSTTKLGEVTLTDGLTDAEVEALEKKYGFVFPCEYLEFLQTGVPVGAGWHDWHRLASDSIPLGFEGDTVSQQIQWNCTPENEDGYYEDWAPDGEKSLEKAIELATKTYPLIPMRSHRCIVTAPFGREGLPVISMHQCDDNIPYGNLFAFT